MDEGWTSYRPIGLWPTIQVSMTSPHNSLKSRAADYKKKMIGESRRRFVDHIPHAVAHCRQLQSRETSTPQLHPSFVELVSRGSAGPSCLNFSCHRSHRSRVHEVPVSRRRPVRTCSIPERSLQHPVLGDGPHRIQARTPFCRACVPRG